MAVIKIGSVCCSVFDVCVCACGFKVVIIWIWVFGSEFRGSVWSGTASCEIQEGMTIIGIVFRDLWMILVIVWIGVTCWKLRRNMTMIWIGTASCEIQVGVVIFWI